MTVKHTIARRVDGVYTDVEVDLTGDKLADYNARFDAPVYPSHAEAIAALTAYVDQFAATVTGDVPIDEKLSWSAKRQQRRL